MLQQGRFSGGHRMSSSVAEVTQVTLVTHFPDNSRESHDMET